LQFIEQFIDSYEQFIDLYPPVITPHSFSNNQANNGIMPNYFI